MNIQARIRILPAIGLVLLVWLAGMLTMELPFGDPLMRLGYDYLHLFISHPPDSNVLVIAINETTESKLGMHQGDPFSRGEHAKLLERLKQAGANLVCYDILFDRPAPDPKDDAAFAAAIKDYGHVMLGAVEESNGTDHGVSTSTVTKPASILSDAAEGWGLLNAATLDPDGVIRRFNVGTELVPSLAVAAAKAAGTEPMDVPPDGRWLCYQTLPGGIATKEFADCLDPAVVPDKELRGKTIFIGGQYATDAHGRPDVFPTPYTRFGAPSIPGVEWHANAFLNARDNNWLAPAGAVRNSVWSLPMALMSLLLFKSLRIRVVLAVWLLATAALAGAAIYLIWNDHVLFNWLALGVVQFPLCLGAALIHHLAKPKIRYLTAPNRRAIDKVAVFISFSSKDEVVAARLEEFLTGNGHPAWLSKQHLDDASDFIAEIELAIEKCQAVLFVLSKDSLQSSFCKKELALGTSKKKRIVPLRIDDAPIPRGMELLITDVQHVDGRGLELPVLLSVAFAAVDRAIAEGRSRPAPEGK